MVDTVLEAFFFSIALITFGIICINDFLFFRIENSLVITSIIYSVLLFLAGLQECSVLYSITTAALLFCGALLLNHFNLLGGGDVKLLFGIGLITASRLFEFFCILSITSFIMVILYSFLYERISRFRAYYAIQIFRSKLTFLKRIVFPSSIKITRKELLEDIRSSSYRNSILRQEIPYGIILSAGSLASIYSLLFGK